MELRHILCSGHLDMGESTFVDFLDHMISMRRSSTARLQRRCHSTAELVYDGITEMDTGSRGSVPSALRIPHLPISMIWKRSFYSILQHYFMLTDTLPSFGRHRIKPEYGIIIRQFTSRKTRVDSSSADTEVALHSNDP
jgi:hypothetical protein